MITAPVIVEVAFVNVSITSPDDPNPPIRNPFESLNACKVLAPLR